MMTENVKMEFLIENWRRFISEAYGAGTIETMRVFDFDDTIAETESDVIIKRPPDYAEEKMSPAEYAVYEPRSEKDENGQRINSKGEIFDFREFAQITNPQELNDITAIFKRLLAAGPDGRYVSILTARGPAANDDIRAFLRIMADESGLDGDAIAEMDIVTLDSADPGDKANWILDKASEFPDLELIEFFDDSPKNREATERLLKTELPDVNINVIDPADLEGRVEQFLPSEEYEEKMATSMENEESPF